LQSTEIVVGIVNNARPVLAGRSADFPALSYAKPTPFGTHGYRMRNLDPLQVRQFQRRLIRWYERHGRDLPWRRTRDPYRILVSEVMLQQTQVERVIEYYGRFVNKYPSFEALAQSSEFEVREAWDGLGYYARARNLYRTARQIVAAHGGKLPPDAHVIRNLPGIGPYTAGAVLSFAYGKDTAILDTNAARVLTRLFKLRQGGSKGRAQKRLWQIAHAVTPAGRADRFNQAIMDLGATICRPRQPDCPRCPVRKCCRSVTGAGTPASRRP
jgi:A/G-specific adenine glycosylase